MAPQTGRVLPVEVRRTPAVESDCWEGLVMTVFATKTKVDAQVQARWAQGDWGKCARQTPLTQAGFALLPRTTLPHPASS